MDNHNAPNMVEDALRVATHPEARIIAMGEAPVDGRSLFARMNMKVRILALSAVIIPAVLIAQGFSHVPSATPPDATASQDQPTQGAQQTAPVAAPQAAPLAQKGQALAANSPLAASPTANVAASKPRLETILPNGGKGMTSYELSTALLPVDPFAALATAIETFQKKPYYDAGGLNVGMGYCITKRLGEYGSTRVRADLRDAGFTPRQVEALIVNKRDEVKRISVDPIHAVRLLESTKPDYRSLAQNTVGKQTFDKLPLMRQTMLTYLAYNTGHIELFPDLVSAIVHGNDNKAMRNMRVSWHDKDGLVHINHRLRAYLQVIFLGEDHFKRALSNPNAFESFIAAPQAESALADIAGAAQSPKGLSDKLLARRLSSNPWASQALAQEKHKTSAPNIKAL